MEYPKHDYKEYPKSLPPDDFWGQVRRTINGKPVSDAQIKLIVDSIVKNLDLAPQDGCLDLACGNGCLSSHLFNYCKSLFGIDASEYLINVAKRNFERPPEYMFETTDVSSYVLNEPQPERFNKVLCYGSFSYFSIDDAVLTLETLARRFTNVKKVLIGNLPDRNLVTHFYKNAQNVETEIDNHETQIGIWRNTDQFRELAHNTGWNIEISRMNKDFYAAHYRFDAILTR